jgi:hypothetical protein
VLLVRRPEALGYPEFDRLTDQLSSLIPEQLFALAVQQQDLAMLIDHHQPVRRRVDQRRRQAVERPGSILRPALCFRRPRRFDHPSSFASRRHRTA